MAATDMGLEDVVVSTSSICDVNGKAGQLIYRGYDIKDLVAHTTFEEVIYLLWHEDLPNRKQLDELNAALKAARALPPQVVSLLKELPKTAAPMDLLRTAVSMLGLYDPDGRDNSAEVTRRKAIRLTAQIPSIVAAWHRIREGKELIAPDSNLSAAANMLYMMNGE